MNFLAHSVLAFDDTALLAGQFAGDFVRGRDLSGYAPGVRAGIRLHRRIDAFTDAHPAVVAARRTFDPDTRRHAGIVVDVVFDHLLARGWPMPAGRDLASHARWVDAALTAHADGLPEALGRFARSLARERTLERNVDVRTVGRTLERLSRRSPRMAPLAREAVRAAALAERLAAPFALLWPALESMATEALEGISEETCPDRADGAYLGRVDEASGSEADETSAGRADGTQGGGGRAVRRAPGRSDAASGGRG